MFVFFFLVALFLLFLLILERFFRMLLFRYVIRVVNVKEDNLEVLYERRLRNKVFENEEEKGLEVDRVNVFLIKILDGKF